MPKCPEIFSSDVVTDRKSKFQGHIAIIKEFSDVISIRKINPYTCIFYIILMLHVYAYIFLSLKVAAVMSNLLSNRKIASATHNIAAYRFKIITIYRGL